MIDKLNIIYLYFIIVYFEFRIFKFLKMNKLQKSRNIIFLDNVIRIFTNNNQLFLDTVINAIEKPPPPKQIKSPTRQPSFLSHYETQILNVLGDFFNKQMLKLPHDRHLRKVYSILSESIDKVYFVTYFNNSFWRLESKLRIPLLQLISKNDYYLAKSVDEGKVYLIPKDFIFSSKMQNNYEKIEY